VRYSFMSFSLPEADLTEFVGAAQRYGYDGVEPRVGGGHRHGIELDTSPAQRREIRSFAADHGVAVACVSAGCRFADPGPAAEQIPVARRVIELAADLDSHRVRVFGGQFPDDVSRETAHASIVGALRELAPFAADHGVTVVMETHDAWTVPAHVAAIMSEVDHPAIGVNWDVMHPPRTGGCPTLQEAHTTLRPWIKHVHMHDATSRSDILDFKPMGEGEFDHRIVLSLLAADGYDGYLSGEWIDWEPGEIHLPREIAAIRGYERELHLTQ